MDVRGCHKFGVLTPCPVQINHAHLLQFLSGQKCSFNLEIWKIWNNVKGACIYCTHAVEPLKEPGGLFR
jgi:hypothetical protein